ncbi:MAG: DJ-1/PfpI family protein [Hyphomicrobiaceae bacterium]
MTRKLDIGFLLFPNLTQLDLTGPYEVFSRLPEVRVHLVWKTRDLVISDTGMAIMPDMTLDECPQLDVICVPGGPGVNPLLDDEAVLGFLSRQAAQAKLITSVCTGALVLGAAGLLEGYKAATHWASMHFLKEFGAIATHSRVVADRNRITGGGVTAGIDFGLEIAARLADENVAQRIQLYLEYNPAPPFPAGSPDRAPAKVLSAFKDAANSMLEERALAVRRASSRRARDGRE